MKKELLITGVNGFVGRNLRKRLRKLENVTISGCSRQKRDVADYQGEIDHLFTVDELFGEERNRSFHTYLHLAGKVYNTGDRSSDKEFDEANYLLTKRIYHRFLEDPEAETFIFMSTIHVLTENPTVVLDEEFVPQPFTPYGKSKHKAEKYILTHLQRGKKIYLLRPGMIHGPGSRGNLISLYNWIRLGLPYPFGAINNKRSFVSIDNLSFVIEQILTTSVPSGLYHIADDEPTYTHDLVQLIAEATGKRARIWNVHPRLLQAIAKIGTLLRLPVNEHRYNKLTGDFVVSNQKIKEALGQPLPVRAEEGLKKTIRSFTEEAQLSPESGS